MSNKLAILLFVFVWLVNPLFSQTEFYEPLDLNSIKWSIDDFGKMWTFDSVPIENFEKKYGFIPTQNWLDDVQKSALEFGGGCSAAFVSTDGLIMTNHHCGRDQLITIQNEGENLLKDGFYANDLSEERKLKNLFVDQLLSIEDVTNIIKNFMENGKTDDEKIKNRDFIIDSLITKNNSKTGLRSKVVSLYNGGKYSLYTYKRYDDVRLVMAPDFQIAATGWDWDNFTYPRYELDFMFYRAYENDKPAKVNNYFKWSKEGAKEGEPIFVVGRPGKTDRLISIAELEYYRDYIYPQALIGFNSIYKAYYNLYMKNTEREELLNNVMGWGNARKSYAGRLAGLKNPLIMKRKIDFEKDLIERIKSTEELNQKYGTIWDSIKLVIDELKTYSVDNSIIRFSRFIRPVYASIARDLINLAKQKELPEEDRKEEFKKDQLQNTINSIYPNKIDFDLQRNLILANVEFVTKILNPNDEIIKTIYLGKKGSDAVEDLLSRSKLVSKELFLELANKNSNEILSSDDPFIKYILEIDKRATKISQKTSELNNRLAVLNQLLGEAIFSLYGDKISPDATSTLRISDGVIKGYEYNGTIAPGKTTYYGLWDRYESFDKKTYPWGLHQRWQIPPPNLNLATAIGFASTNDIVGGNSGSSVINVNKEIVGLVHDGNIESLAGHTIFLEENNRTVATDSKGLIEALKHVYKTERLVNELLNGKIQVNE